MRTLCREAIERLLNGDEEATAATDTPLARVKFELLRLYASGVAASIRLQAIPEWAEATDRDSYAEGLEYGIAYVNRCSSTSLAYIIAVISSPPLKVTDEAKLAQASKQVSRFAKREEKLFVC